MWTRPRCHGLLPRPRLLAVPRRVSSAVLCVLCCGSLPPVPWRLLAGRRLTGPVDPEGVFRFQRLRAERVPGPSPLVRANGPFLEDRAHVFGPREKTRAPPFPRCTSDAARNADARRARNPGPHRLREAL